MTFFFINRFSAAPYNFFDKNGVFLSSVNGVINSGSDNFHWLVKLDGDLEKKDDLVDYQPLGNISNDSVLVLSLHSRHWA